MILATPLPCEDINHCNLRHIYPLINRLAEIFAAQYMPNQENAIHEILVKFKGQLGFKQYMPMKPTKRGIKVWTCADSITHFVSRFQVNPGQPWDGQEYGLEEHVVIKLSSDLEHGYYNINYDNFFPTKSKQVSSTVEDCEASPWQVYCNAEKWHYCLQLARQKDI